MWNLIKVDNDVNDVVLVPPLLILGRFYTLFSCFHCWLWRIEYRFARFENFKNCQFNFELWYIHINSEAATWCVQLKKVFLRFSKIRKKTPAPESHSYRIHLSDCFCHLCASVVRFILEWIGRKSLCLSFPSKTWSITWWFVFQSTF